MASFSASSAEVIQTQVPSGSSPRSFYLQSYTLATPPYLSHSTFLPHSLVVHLMRNKKDSAIAAKFLKHHREGITNIEGALHTFLTPVVPIFLHGDYKFGPGHRVLPLPDLGQSQCARIVVLSALVQLDFEDEQVMLHLSRLEEYEFAGAPLPDGFSPLNTATKQNAEDRAAYDAALKQHVVFNLMFLRTLPPRSSVIALSISSAESLLSTMIKNGTIRSVNGFVRVGRGQILSLELLFRTALEQARNEFRALERLCKKGYVYTFDPPSIFARELSATLLNRLTIGALHALARESILKGLRVYAFNDYADHDALPLVRVALSTQAHVIVMKKAALFGNDGHYAPPHDCRGALLVIHNNSDGFGQNIETEGPTSLDGAIGVYSSAAASLHRQHPHLVANIV